MCSEKEFSESPAITPGDPIEPNLSVDDFREALFNARKQIHNREKDMANLKYEL